MIPARKIRRVLVSDPRSVLRAISGNSSCQLNDSSSKPEERIDETTDASASVKLKPLRIDPDTNPIVPRLSEESLDAWNGSEEAPIESVQQIQQLAIRLKQSETELDQRESELNERMRKLDQTTLKQQKLFDEEQSRIDQQSSQVRCQQLHLMQLQTDIVKSHEATKAAVEALVRPSQTDQEIIAAFKALNYELGGRFDYITRRWEHLAELMNRDRVQNIATRSIDDSADWMREGC